MNVIHFFELQELAAELEPGTIVRLETSMRYPATDNCGVSEAVLEIDVRANQNAETVLVWHSVLGRYLLVGNTPLDDDRMKKVRARDPIARNAVHEYLDDYGFKVRPGLIDIGEAKVVNGHWYTLSGCFKEQENDLHNE